MYLVSDDKREEFHGVTTDSPVMLIYESFSGEVYELFLKQTIDDGFVPSINVNDEFTGDEIEIEASEHLSVEQIEFLKIIDEEPDREAFDDLIAA